VLFLTVLGVDALMVRQISRLLTVYLQTGGTQNTSAERRGISKTSAPELAPLKPDTADLSSPPARGGVAFASNDEAVRETAALHATARDTHEVPADTNEQELPTRKL
jgi:hypothetical protein